MRRRDFIALIGGTAAAVLPFAARAQHATAPVIGLLGGLSLESYGDPVAAFRQGLQETGYTEGQNLSIEYRWAEGHYDRLPALAAELVRIPVDVIATAGGSPVAQAAKAATQTIPIVFSSGPDPVKLGLVESLSHPGGNMTGVTSLSGDLISKRLELLTELLPRAVTIAVFVNPNNLNEESDARATQDAARQRGVEVFVVRASQASELETAFATLVQRRAAALLIGPDPWFTYYGDRLVALAAHHSIPTIAAWRDLAAAGCLMSYGTHLADAYRQVGIYVGKILKGAKPADLPVVQSAKVELVANLKTAKALGITIPQSILARADEVIE
jgi:putative tryptophan/tyrosine transport system substrate-binding protein